MVNTQETDKQEDKKDEDSNKDNNKENVEDKEAESNTIKYMLINDWAASQHHAKTGDNKSVPLINLPIIKPAANVA